MSEEWIITEDDRERWNEIFEWNIAYLPDVPDEDSDIEDVKEFVKFSLKDTRFEYVLEHVIDYDFDELDGEKDILVEAGWMWTGPSRGGNEFIPLIVVEYLEGYKLVDGFHRLKSVLKEHYHEIDLYNIPCLILKLDVLVSAESIFY